MKRTLRSKGNLVRLGVTFAVMLLIGAVLVGPVQAADEEASDKSFVSVTRCEGFGVFQTLPADAATVRSVGNVPDEFTLRGEATGTTFLTVGAFICNPAVIDGVDVGRFLYANVSVQLASHSGGYDIWQFTDLPAVHSRLQRIGIFSPLLKDMEVDIDTIAGGPVSGSASIPWTSSPYILDAAIDPATAPFVAGINACSSPPRPSAGGCFVSDHWFKGPQGTVYSAHANCNASAAPAAVTIRAAAGSPLAEILGAQEVTVSGLWLRFEATALTDFGEAFVEGRAERPECMAIP